MSIIVNNCFVNIIDIGASGGIHPRFKKFIKNIRAILFEPDPREFSRLKESVPNNYIVLNTALSEIPGEADFNLCRKQQVSSVYLPNKAFLSNFPDIERFSITNTVKMVTDTLDNQLEKNGLIDIDFIKIDTEGSELSILKGANNILRTVMGLELEICFAPIRENQPLFHDVNKYVTELGYQLLDIKRYYWKRCNTHFHNFRKGQIIFGDALYFRSPESICDLFETDERKIIACFLLLLSYGYLDLAETLYHLAKKRKIISGDAINDLKARLGKYRPRVVMADFKGKQRIYNIITRIANIFRSNTWATGDREIGN